jgi:hypothetical protein
LGEEHDFPKVRFLPDQTFNPKRRKTMAGVYVSIIQDFQPEDDCRDYAQDEVGAPSRANGRTGKTVIIGRTHGCSCCSNDEDVTLAGIELHIERLKAELERAEKVKEVLVAAEKSANIQE